MDEGVDGRGYLGIFPRTTRELSQHPDVSFQQRKKMDDASPSSLLHLQISMK